MKQFRSVGNIRLFTCCFYEAWVIKEKRLFAKRVFPILANERFLVSFWSTCNGLEKTSVDKLRNFL